MILSEHMNIINSQELNKILYLKGLKKNEINNILAKFSK